MRDDMNTHEWWSEEPRREMLPVGKLTDDACDKILRGVFGNRVQRCPGCNGVGRTTETFDVWGRHDAVRPDMTCPVCNSKGLISVYAEAA